MQRASRLECLACAIALGGCVADAPDDVAEVGMRESAIETVEVTGRRPRPQNGFEPTGTLGGGGGRIIGESPVFGGGGGLPANIRAGLNDCADEYKDCKAVVTKVYDECMLRFQNQQQTNPSGAEGTLRACNQGSEVGMDTCTQRNRACVAKVNQGR